MYTDFKEGFLLQFLFKTGRCTIYRKRQLAQVCLRKQCIPGFPAFGTQIDNMVGIFDHFHVMLDNNNGVASFKQRIKGFQECFDIMKM